MSEPHREFRWQFHDDALGEEWSGWHSTSGPCSACCCLGPEDGEHREAAEYYDEDGFLSSGHTRLDPDDLDDHDHVVWRDPQETTP